VIPFIKLERFRKLVRARDTERFWINVQLRSGPHALERGREFLVEGANRSVRDCACVGGMTRLRRAWRLVRRLRIRSQEQIGSVAHSEELICAAAPVRMRFQSLFAERCLYVASAGVRCNA